MDKFFIGVDIGGTNIKTGIISENNNIIDSLIYPTKSLAKEKKLSDIIKEMVQNLFEKNNLSLDQLLGVGVGIPGIVDKETGEIKRIVNLNCHYENFLDDLKKYFNVPIKLLNDADIALLAEQKLGAGKGFQNIVMLTLGTGIGGNVVLNGKHLGLECCFPFEVGHMKVQGNNNKCNCGEIGCFETIGSTKALVSDLKNAINENPTSAIWKKYNISNIDGKTIFEFPKDYTAKETLKNYIKNVGAGIVSLVNIFKPEIVIIGGAISEQKDNFIAPLEIYVNRHNFFKQLGYTVKVVPASLLNDAGMIGAKLLFD